MFSLGDSITIFNCLDIQQELVAYLNQCEKECLIDAGELTDIDACGLQLLVSLKKSAKKKQLSFEIINIHKDIEASFQKLGLERFLVKENV